MNMPRNVADKLPEPSQDEFAGLFYRGIMLHPLPWVVETRSGKAFVVDASGKTVKPLADIQLGEYEKGITLMVNFSGRLDKLRLLVAALNDHMSARAAHEELLEALRAIVDSEPVDRGDGEWNCAHCGGPFNQLVGVYRHSPDCVQEKARTILTKYTPGK